MIIGITGFAGSGKNTAASMIPYVANNKPFELWEKDHMEYPGLHVYNTEGFDIIWWEKSFASKVKDICSILTGIPREDWDNRELRNKKLPIEGLSHACVKQQMEVKMTTQNDVIWKVIENYTYRTFMQRVGTDAMRDVIHQDIWINALMVDYKWTLGPGWVPSYNDPDNSGCHPNAEPEYPNWVIPDLRFMNEAKEIKDRNGIIIRINKSTYADDNHASEFEHLQIVPDYVVSNDATFEHLWEQMVFVLTKLNLIQ